MKKLFVLTILLGLIGISFQSPVILAETRTTTLNMEDPEFTVTIPIPGNYPDFADYGCKWVDSEGSFTTIGCPLVPDGPIGHCCESPALYIGFWKGDPILMEFNNHRAIGDGFEYHAWVIGPNGPETITVEQIDNAVNLLRAAELLSQQEEKGGGI